ncbi:hypothetical protein HG531_006637 [Fusarium graminearum]|nr:hypothetical protein HG531_006637 [Fusarium graminearum]
MKYQKSIAVKARLLGARLFDGAFRAGVHAAKDLAAESVEFVSVLNTTRGFHKLLLDRVDLDLAKELGEEILVASVVKKRQGAVTLLEVGEFGGISGNGWALVVALAIVGELDRPANKDQVGVLGGDRVFHRPVKQRVEAVLADDIGLILERCIMLQDQVRIGLLLVALVVGVEDLNLHIGVHGLVRRQVGRSHKLLGRDDIDSKRDNSALLLALSNVGVVWEDLDISEFGGLENISGRVLTIKHGAVELHSKVKSLPVKGGHLNPATPVVERIEVVGSDASSVRVDSHHVAHVVDIEGHLLILSARVLGKARLHEREDMVVLLRIDSVEARELDSSTVNTEVTKNLDGLVVDLLDWLLRNTFVVACAAAQHALNLALSNGIDSSLADQSSR